MKKYMCLVSLVIAVVFYGHAADKDDVRKITSNVGVVAAYVATGLHQAQQRLATMRVSDSASKARQTESQIIFGAESGLSKQSALDASGDQVELSFSKQESGPRDPYGSAVATSVTVDSDLSADVAAFGIPNDVPEFLKQIGKKPLASNQGYREYSVEGHLAALLIYTKAIRASEQQIQNIFVDNDETKQSKEFREWALGQLEALTNKKDPAENMGVDQGLSDRLQDEFGIKSTFKFKGPKWQLVRSKKQ